MFLWCRRTNHGPYSQPLHLTPTDERTGRNTIVERADNILVDARCTFYIIDQRQCHAQEVIIFLMLKGPLANTIEDFWRMVWLENVSSVVMLTKLKERKEVGIQYLTSRTCLVMSIFLGYFIKILRDFCTKINIEA